jgi:putative flippase GtrA
MNADPVRSDPRGSRLASFVRFAGLSGMGWVLDTAILLALIHATTMPSALANIISSCTASLMVFVVSRQFVFQAASHYFAARVALYLGYVLAVIFVASFALSGLVRLLAPMLAPHVTIDWLPTAAAGLAKVLVTPPQLLLNFLVARHLTERVVTAGGMRV